MRDELTDSDFEEYEWNDWEEEEKLDDCMDCGLCEACIEQTKAYYEQMEKEQP